MGTFGQRSTTNLSTCHRDLQLIARTAIKNCPVDFGIHEGHRTEETQLEYFEAGKSRIDPRIPELKAKGKHLSNPSLAFDYHISEKHGGKSLAWDDIHLSFVAGYLIATAHALYNKGEITHLLRWAVIGTTTEL